MREPGADARYVLEIHRDGASIVDYATGDGLQLKPGDCVYIDPAGDHIDVIPDSE